MAIQEATFKVEGMSCNHCKTAVEKALKKLDGVNQVTVSLEKKEVTVSFNPGKTSREELVKAIEEQAYKVVG